MISYELSQTREREKGTRSSACACLAASPSAFFCLQTATALLSTDRGSAKGGGERDDEHHLINVLERATGVDLDGDGDVGVDGYFSPVGHHDDEAEEDKFLDNLLAVVPLVLNWPYKSAQKVNRALVRNGLLPPPPQNLRRVGDLGLKWKNVGNTQPMEGKDLKNLSLEEALKGKTQFTRQEWEGFGIKGLRRIDFVKSGASYFKPDGGQDDDDESSAGGDKQLGTRKSRKQVLVCIVLYAPVSAFIIISHTACNGVGFVSYDPLDINLG